MMRIAICDDEAPARAALSRLIRRQSCPCEILEYAGAEECLADAEGADLLFLDIQLSGMDGMALARTLRERELPRRPVIVFVTGYERYVYDAFDVGAFHYLLKPLDEEKFAQVFRRAAEQIRAGERRMVTLRFGGLSRAVPVDSIRWIESSGHRVLLHRGEGVEQCAGKIGALEAELGQGFFRVHKGYLVNLRCVESYTKTEAVLRGGARVPISKYKYQDFVRAYLRFLRQGAAL